MSINRIEINTNALQRDTAEIEDYLNKIQTDKNELVSSMQELNGMWEGSAHDAFINQFNIDMQRIDELTKDIEAYLSTLRNAVGVYNRCEDEIENMVRAINI